MLNRLLPLVLAGGDACLWLGAPFEALDFNGAAAAFAGRYPSQCFAAAGVATLHMAYINQGITWRRNYSTRKIRARIRRALATRERHPG